MKMIIVKPTYCCSNTSTLFKAVEVLSEYKPVKTHFRCVYCQTRGLFNKDVRYVNIYIPALDRYTMIEFSRLAEPLDDTEEDFLVETKEVEYE